MTQVNPTPSRWSRWKKSWRMNLALLALVVIIGVVSRLPEPNRADQIREGCEREFGSEGEARVNTCRLNLMMREVEQQDAAKLERAARP